MLKISSYLLILLFSLEALPAFAQPSDTQPTNTQLTDAQLTEIIIKGSKWASPSNSVLTAETISKQSPSRDTGELLRLIPGVSAGRMGGHGVDPVIRGQKASQLTITKDGSYILGGCPNRMDPPASLLTIDEYSTLNVHRGYSSVVHGPGATGGVVNVETAFPEFRPGQEVDASSKLQWDSNGDFYDTTGAVAYIGQHRQFRGRGFFKDSGNYTDGNGDEVRSAFRTFGGGVLAGHRYDDSTVLLGVDRDRIEDALFAGAGMDSPETDLTVARLKAEQRYPHSQNLRSLRFDMFLSDVEHIMDNYSLRPRQSRFARVDSDSVTYGARLIGDFQRTANTAVQVGAQLLGNEREAIRFVNPANRDQVTTIQSYLWPDVAIRQYGLFSEISHTVSSATHVTIGLRYDFVDVDAGKITYKAEVPGNVSPAELYEQYYGTEARFDNEHNISALYRLQHSLSPTLFAVGTLSRSMRTPDATELALANESGMNSWIGNPSLAPEAHHQLDASLAYDRNETTLQTTLSYDWVQDYITRDRARGQQGVQETNSASVYRNVDASFFTVEALGEFSLPLALTLITQGAYTRGENEDDDRPLPQIPPFYGSTSLRLDSDDWDASLRVRYAARQNRVDEDPSEGSGLDARKTPAFAVIDVLGGFTIADGLQLRAGITNLFDRTYANHLNRSNTFDPEQVQVNEPGRSFSVQLLGKL